MDAHQLHAGPNSGRAKGYFNTNHHTPSAIDPAGHPIEYCRVLQEGHDEIIDANVKPDPALHSIPSLPHAAAALPPPPPPTTSLLPTNSDLAQSQHHQDYLTNEFSALQTVLSSPFAAAVQLNNATATTTAISSSDDSDEMTRNQRDISAGMHGAQDRTNLVSEAIHYIELLEARQARLVDEKSALEKAIFRSKRLLFLAGGMQYG